MLLRKYFPLKHRGQGDLTKNSLHGNNTQKTPRQRELAHSTEGGELTIKWGTFTSRIANTKLTLAKRSGAV